jgi:carbonic anhydrase
VAGGSGGSPSNPLRGIRALLEPIPPDREAHLGRWVEFTRPAHQLIAAAHVPEAEALTATIKAHVQFQLLMTYDIVRAGVAVGRLKIHGWLYDMETGSLIAYDPSDSSWRGLLEMAGTEAAAGT